MARRERGSIKARIKRAATAEQLHKGTCRKERNSRAVHKGTCRRKHDQCIILTVLAVDLIASEAHCHTSCRTDYTGTGDLNEKCNNDSKAIEEQAAHQEALSICAIM